MAQVFSDTVAPPRPPARVHAGEYFSTDRDLYRVEEIHGEFALIEDCRTEMVLELAVSEIVAMNRVRPSAA